jgi:hypothetical protein
MSAKLLRSLALLVAVISFCSASQAQNAASAKAFLNSIYSNYQNGQKGVDFDGPQSGLYFTSSLLALEKADVKANGPDNVPAIDYDPVCGCQDWDGIWGLEIKIEIQALQKAQASVSFSLRDPKYRAKDETRRLVITLAVEHGAWRIDDVLDQSDPNPTFSVRKSLENDLAQLAHNPAPASPKS